MISKRLVMIAAAVAGMTLFPASARAELETFVMGTTGQSNYSTYGAPKPVDDNFSNWGGSLPTNPAGLAASGISGTYRVKTSAVAALSDAITSSGTGRSNFGPWTYSGSAATNAGYGALGSESHAVLSGNSDNATVNNAESYAIMRDSLSPTSPGVAAGSNGTMRLAVTVGGAMSVSGRGDVGMILRYDTGAPRPGYATINQTLLESSLVIYGNGYSVYGPHSSFGSYVTPAGMNLHVGAITASGSPTDLSFGGVTTVYATLPVTYGAATDFRMGMLTWAGVGNGDGTMDSAWAHTARISGIEMFDSAGNPVKDFSITSGSGTAYTASGVAVVPEGGTLVLSLAAAGAVVVRRRRKPAV